MKRISPFVAIAWSMVLAAGFMPASLLATPPEAPESVALPANATVHPRDWPRIAWPKVNTAADEARISTLLAQMDAACKAYSYQC